MDQIHDLEGKRAAAAMYDIFRDIEYGRDLVARKCLDFKVAVTVCVQSGQAMLTSSLYSWAGRPAVQS